jgi:predicted Zn-ribbon and HTH transcriptional regulator
MICSKCGEASAHRSHRAGIKDRLVRIFQMIPYRCRKCGHRFYAYRAGETSSKLRTHEERKIMELRARLRWKRSKRELLAYGFGALILIVIVYVAIQQRIVSE